MPIRFPLGKHSPHQKSLHPSRRMAWKKLRHGEAVNFLSPRKKTRQSLTNKHVPIKFYKISKNNSVLFCYYKIKVYLCSVIKDPFCPFGHLPLYGKNWQSAVVRTESKSEAR